MANWNLSVDLRGQGTDLVKKLRQSATAARALGAAARDAKKEVTGLGNASRLAGDHIRTLGSESRTAGTRIRTLGTGANNTTRTVKQLGTASDKAGDRMAVMATKARSAAADMRKLERAVAEADAQIRALDRQVKIRVEFDDQTATGATAVRKTIDGLKALGPINIAALVDNQTATGAAAVRTSVNRLKALSPINLKATLNDQTAAGIASTQSAVTALSALSPLELTARLDDQTAAGLASIQAAMATAGGLGPLDLKATLDDQTGPGVAAVNAAIVRLKDLSPVTLDINVNGDTTQITAAAAAMRDLRTNTGSASQRFSTLRTSSAATAVALNAVQNAAQDASRALRTLRGRAAACAAAFDDLAVRARAVSTSLRSLNTNAQRSDTRLGALSDRTRTLRTDMDDLDGSLARVGGRMGALRGSLGTLGSSAGNASGGMRKLILAAIALGTALIPIAAAAVPLALGMTAAAAGVGIFGAAIGGQIATMVKASEAHKKYEEAVTEHGKTSTEAATAEKAYLKEMAKMPPATREAAAGLEVMQSQYRNWSDSLADETMPVATKSFAAFGELFPKLTGTVQGSSRQLDRFMTIVTGGIQSPSFDSFMDNFAEFSEKSLAKANSGLVRFSQSAGSDEVGSNVRQFMDYAKTNGPLVGETLIELTKALSHIVVAASETGVSMLTVVNAFAQLVNAIPTDLLSGLLQIAIVLKGVSLATAGMAAAGLALGPATGRMSGFIRAARFGGIASAISGVAASMSMLQKSTVVLAVLALVAVGISKLADSAKGAPPDVDKLATSLANLSLSGKFTGELKRTFGDMDGFVAKVKQMDSQTDQLDKAKPYLALSGLGSFAEGAAKKLDSLVHGTKSMSATEEDFKSFDKTFASMASSGDADLAAAEFQRFAAALRASGKSTKEINALFPEYKAAVAGLAAEEEIAARAMGAFGQQAISTQKQLDAQKSSADGLRQSIVALNEVNRAALGGQIGYEASIDAAAKAATKNAGALKMVNGELDLNSPKAQAAATALSDMATKTDEYATSARASGKSWEVVNGIYKDGEANFLKFAQSMGLSKEQAQQFADTVLKIPEKKEMLLEMRTEDAVAGLDSVISKIQATPGTKSVTVKALTTDAVGMLESLGYTVTQLPNGQFEVKADTGSAGENLLTLQGLRNGLADKTITIGVGVQKAITDLQTVQGKIAATKGKSVTVNALTAAAKKSLEDLGFKVKTMKNGKVSISIPTGGPKAAVSSIQGAIDGMYGKTISVMVEYRAKNSASKFATSIGGFSNADGNVVDYANGGVHRGDQPGARYFADGGENHTAQIARPGEWRIWAEPETQGESYIPLAPSKRGRSRAITEETVRRLGGDPKGIQWNADGGVTDWRYDPNTGSLYSPTDAGSAGNKTKKVKGKEVSYFSLSAVESKLKSTAKATAAWNKDLQKIADLAGGDVAIALASMGKDGIALTHKMATGSTKYLNEMSAALRNLGATAKASLADYTRQITAATATDSKFAANLATLAGRGYGDLAKQLAAQGDTAAMELATAAVGDNKKASAANTAAGKANTALTSEQVQQLVAIIASVRTSSTGLHDVADATGLGEDAIVATAGKATAQIKSSLGSRATKFLADLARAQKGMSYANGGIRPGIYSTQGGAVTFAEPETGGEAYLPLGASKRSAAMPVLRDVASRFGVGLTDLAAARPYVIVRDGGDTNVTVTAVRTGATASDIGSQVGRSVRRARRGGVAARAGS